MTQSTNIPHTILVVDDDQSILNVLEARLESAGFSVLLAKDGTSALQVLKQHEIDLVITDVKMPKMDGKQLLQEIQTRWTGLPVIVLTAYASIPDAVKAVKYGAANYLEKPFQGEDLIELIDENLQEGRPRRRSSNNSTISEKLWGGKSPAMDRVYDMISRVAPTDADVLLLGESGTGKELAAQIIHNLSPRSAGPFSIVDCGATTHSLLESELFGHKRGAFTSAVSNRKGLIEEADHGTLFLDEIGTLPLDMQSKLLRFLQERTIRRVGASQHIHIDCRIIAATNADLPSMVTRGEFREDLYFRLKGISIEIPPLRKRIEDISLLAERLLVQLCNQGNYTPKHISEQAMQSLKQYHWPGNVRELKQMLRTALILSSDTTIQPKHLQFEQGENQTGEEDIHSPSLSLEDSERTTILRALEQSGWVQVRAAKLLGISRRAMHYKIKKFGIQPKNKKS
ncbi:MAG: sigma-54-dependent transcriptional regulator [Thermodesulfobacteriota bacterium]